MCSQDVFLCSEFQQDTILVVYQIQRPQIEIHFEVHCFTNI